jgi:hypothetical protein
VLPFLCVACQLLLVALLLLLLFSQLQLLLPPLHFAFVALFVLKHLLVSLKPKS